MGLWAKSIVIFHSIRAYGKQSIRSLADRTGLSKAAYIDTSRPWIADRYPESSCWETPGAAPGWIRSRQWPRCRCSASNGGWERRLASFSAVCA